MRGRHEEQEVMLAYVNLEERVPKDHPLRAIKAVADEALGRLSPEFDRMYSRVGRASVPPERLLKASLLISLYSVVFEDHIAQTHFLRVAGEAMHRTGVNIPLLVSHRGLLQR